MNNTNCLTADEMAVVGTVFKECFETELSKYSEDQKFKIKTFVFEHTNTVKLHTLFSPVGLKNITEIVFNDVDIRDFVLCLSDQFSCITALSDFNERSVQYSIGYGLDSPDIKDNKFILIPERIYENMELSGELIIDILNANRWLLTLVLTYLFFGKTSLFSLDLINNVTTDKKQ
jgi:hypothetical protein